MGHDEMDGWVDDNPVLAFHGCLYPADDSAERVAQVDTCLRPCKYVSDAEITERRGLLDFPIVHCDSGFYDCAL